MNAKELQDITEAYYRSFTGPLDPEKKAVDEKYVAAAQDALALAFPGPRDTKQEEIDKLKAELQRVKGWQQEEVKQLNDTLMSMVTHLLKAKIKD